MSAGPCCQRVRLPGRHAENGRQVGAAKPMPQVQLADLPLHRIQPGQRGGHHSAKLRLLGDGGKLRRVVHGPGRGRLDTSPQPPVTLVARHGKQPRPQPARLTQPRDL